MAANAADFGPSEEELAELQKLSAEYVPDASGPLVSERLSTNAIAAEYARADPVYQVKTATLPQRYSYYRTCRGDGHCGWRAIAFCYYETLLHVHDKHKFFEESARISSLGNLLQTVGHPKDIFEDWEEEVIELLRALPTFESIEEGDAALLDAFNESGPWQSIITYLKVLTGAWIRTHRNNYEPYMGGQAFEDYVSRNIEASQCEIEHVGLSALYDVLLKPAGFALEVLYLDLSPGVELTPHRMEPVDSAGMPLANPPTLRLLYRPGHYDILYSFAEAPPVTRAMNGTAPNGAPHAQMFVGLASPSEEGPANGFQENPHHISFSETMPLIPGMSGVSAPGISSSQGLWMSGLPASTSPYPASPTYDLLSHSSPILHRDYQSSHQPVHSQPPLPPPTVQRIPSHIDQHYPTPISPTPTSYMALPLPPTNSAEMFLQGFQPVNQRSVHGGMAAPPIHVGGLERDTSQFRPSIYQYQSGSHYEAPSTQDTFQTNIFKNSHFNPAHFNNADFQPEEWKPGKDEASHARSRRKSMAPAA